MPTFVQKVIRRLEDELQAEQREIRLRQRELRRELSEKARQYTETELREKRLAGPQPADGQCPRCWYVHGRRVKMEVSNKGDPLNSDLSVCPECLLEREEPV